MKNKFFKNSSFLLFKQNKLLDKGQFSFDTLNFSSSRRKARSFRRKEKLTRPSSASSIFSKKLNFKNQSSIVKHNNNLNVLDLLLENSPNKYSYKKLRSKISSIDNFYHNHRMKPKNRIEEIYYKYNVLYGQNTSNMIRTYSPKMRPNSSSVKKFVKKMKNEQKDSIPVFTEEEINELIKAKCSDIGIDVKDHMLYKFKEFCNSKCKDRIVDFRENFLGLYSIKFLGNILYNSDRISKLNLSKNNLGDAGVELLINAIKYSTSLITLNIASNGITYIGGDIVFKNLVNQQSIIYFNISTIEGTNRNRNRLTYAGIKDIIPFLKNNLFIEYFNLSGNSIKNDGFIAVCKGLNENKAIVTLKLSHNEIGEKGIIQGLKYINTPINQLAYLDMSKNKFLDNGLIALVDQLKNLPNLISLNISFCGFEFLGFEYLLKNLQYNRKLEILNVRGNKLKNENFYQIKPYFPNIGLRSLNMSRCSLCDDYTFKLGEFMEENVTIRRLNISENEISDEGFKSFGALFYKNSSINHFDVSSNFLTNNSVSNMIKSLEFNSSLNSINLYGNQLNNDISNLILQILQKNRTLTYINLYFNRIPMNKIEEINKFIKLNFDRQKQKFIPNLIRSVKQLEFNPNQFQILANKIKNRKIERDFLFKKVKEENIIYSSAMKEQQKDINIKLSESTTKTEQLKLLEQRIQEIDEILVQEDAIFKKKEKEFKEKISIESDYLFDALSDKTLSNKDYISAKMENENILSMTQEKYYLSERALNKVSNSLSSLNKNLSEKTEELEKLLSIKLTKNYRKRTTSFKRNSIFSRSKSKSIINLPHDKKPRPSLSKRIEEKKDTFFNNKQLSEEIKEEDENENKKNIIQIKSKNHFDEKNKNKNYNKEKIKGISKINSDNVFFFPKN